MARSYKAETMKLTGMSSDEYDKKYDVFRKKVRRWEVFTGRKESVTELFMKSFKYPRHQVIKEINQLQTYNISYEIKAKEIMSLAKTTFISFRGLIDRSPKLQELIKDIWTGSNVNETLYAIKQYAKYLHQKQKDSGYKMGTE